MILVVETVEKVQEAEFENETIEAHAYNMSPADKKTVRRIIFEHFDYIVAQWNEFQEKKDG